MTPKAHILDVAILGTGNIGTDLLYKVQRSPYLNCSAFVGRRSESTGIQKAQELGIPTSIEGIQYLAKNHDKFDLVFDATTAAFHFEHAQVLKNLKKFCVDLTPAKIGKMCIPAVNLSESLDGDNVNMVTCGGQASIPIAYALSKSHTNIDYIEVVSSIAAKSAGMGTRENLDEYIHTTEQGVQFFSGSKKAKAILNINPAEPCIHMQTTIFAKIQNPDLEKIKFEVDAIVKSIQEYVPGYQLILGPVLENNRVVIMIRATGAGDFLPVYAGNLDIINCAAIRVAEQFAIRRERTASL